MNKILQKGEVSLAERQSNSSFGKRIYSTKVRIVIRNRCMDYRNFQSTARCHSVKQVKGICKRYLGLFFLYNQLDVFNKLNQLRKITVCKLSLCAKKIISAEEQQKHLLIACFVRKTCTGLDLCKAGRLQEHEVILKGYCRYKFF